MKLTPRMLELMDPIETPKNSRKIDLRLEKDLHQLIGNDLNRRGIFGVHSRMDKKTSQKKGVPDWIFALPRPDGAALPVAIECKRPGERLTEDQEYVRDLMVKNGWFYSVVYSFEEYAEVIRGLLI